jgi:hypothetical protein
MCKIIQLNRDTFGLAERLTKREKENTEFNRETLTHETSTHAHTQTHSNEVIKGEV